MKNAHALIPILLAVCTLAACRARQADPADLAALEASDEAANDEGSEPAARDDADVSDATTARPAPDVGVATSDVALRLNPVEGSGLQLRAVQSLRRPNLQPQNIRIDARVPTENRISPTLTPVRPTQSRGSNLDGNPLLAPSTNTNNP